ncbi:kinesin-like protein KIF6 [Nematolebias whitei]|uniref:kinesin-like protein KIF6 n=1 Tax=Nematolebias whitei TaxID=451745 RepID=UPI0018989C68|nr:kinesin-like protein KIF6 [Nematolebias whitei]
MVKQTIQIFGRIKPTKKTVVVYSVDSKEQTGASLEFVVPRDLADGFVNNKRECYKFRFQKIFDQHTKQEDIFEDIAKPVAESVLAGYNGTIFAYGQTGSGKTFTITGGAERYCDRGIIPRTLSYLYEHFNEDSSMVYTTHISYLEIYNEVGYDLLDSRHEASRLEDLPKVIIREDPEQNIHLRNLSLQQSANEEEALNLLFLGDTNRMIAETPMNQASTRSHCIFTVHICRREPGSATLRQSKLHLVDLAGSDRVSKTGLDGQLLTEAKYINLSLHYLEQVIIALSEKNRSHIPYRNSMLTSVLRDSLGGNCMTTMIATLAVDKRNLDESISTCRFAQRVALIKNEAILNEEMDPALLIAQLKREVVSLEEELAMVTGQQRNDRLTAEEIWKLEELVKAFINDPDPDVTLSLGPDMRKIQRCFSLLKSMLLDKQGERNVRSELQHSPTGRKESVNTTEVATLKEMLKQRDNEISILVKILKKEKQRADDATAQLGNITNCKNLSSQTSSSMSMVSQLKEANVDFFLEKHGGQASTKLQMNEGKVETLTAEYGGRMFTLPQWKDGNTDILFTNCAEHATPVFQFRRRNENVFADDERVSTNQQMIDRKMDTFPVNHEAFTSLQLKERNFQTNHSRQVSASSQVKEENMDTSPEVHGGQMLTRPQLKVENMDIHILQHGGQAAQCKKRGPQFSMGKQEAFEIFIRDHEEHLTIEDNKKILKERSAEARKLGEQLGETKNRINELKKQLEMRRKQKAVHDMMGTHAQEELDPVEENLRKQIKDEKTAYKNTIGCLKALKTEIEHLQLLLERVKVKIQKDFQKWWSQEASNLQESELGAAARCNTASPNGSLLPSSPGTPGFCSSALSSTMKESPTDRDTNPDRAVSLSLTQDLRSPVPINVPMAAGLNKSLDGKMDPDFKPSAEWRDLATTTITSSSIPLTGDQQVDADILAFVMARKNLLSRIGQSQT